MIKKKDTAIEVLVGSISLLFLCWILQGPLTGYTSFSGDNIQHEFPFFFFFAENLINGVLPLWNPYIHGGEPFYFLWGHKQFLEPCTLLTLLFGQFFTKDLLILYVWRHLFQCFVMLFGIYWVLRSIAHHLFTRLCLQFILCFSSLLAITFVQPGNLFWFMWVPYVYLLLEKLRESPHTLWPLPLIAALWGLQLQGTWFIGIALFVSLYFIEFFFNERKQLLELIRNSKFKWMTLLSFVILLCMALPNLSLWFEQKDYLFPVRMMDQAYFDPQSIATENQKGIQLDYKNISLGGSSADTFTFLKLLYPSKWGVRGSESFLMLGILPWFVAIAGILFGIHKRKKFFLLCGLFFPLWMLGPGGGIHPILSQLIPPLRLARHPAQYVYFLAFIILYFFSLGMNFLAERPSFKLKALPILTSTTLFSFMGIFCLKVDPKGFPWFMPLVALGIVVLWFQKEKFTKGNIWVSLMLAHIASVAYWTGFSSQYFSYLALFLFVPLVAFLIFLNFHGMHRSLAAVILLGSLLADLFFHVSAFRPYFSRNPPPTAIFSNYEVQPLSPPGPRRLNPVTDGLSLERHYAYTPLILRKNYLFNQDLDPLLEKRGIRLSLPNRYAYYWRKTFYASLVRATQTGTFPNDLGLNGPDLNYLDYRSHHHYWLRVSSNGTWLWPDGYDSHWNAFLDGKPLKITETESGMKRLHLPSGENVIEVRYFPWKFLVAIALYFIGFFVACGIAGWLWQEEKTKTSVEKRKWWGLLGHRFYGPRSEGAAL